MVTRVQEAAFDFSVEVNNFQAKVKSAGALVTFTGIVRDDSGGLDYMHIEHYPAMTEAALQKIETQAINAFAGADYLMDYLKSRAPFWKKEVSKDHTEWVQAKSTDEAALAAWSRVPKA